MATNGYLDAGGLAWTADQICTSSPLSIFVQLVGLESILSEGQIQELNLMMKLSATLRVMMQSDLFEPDIFGASKHIFRRLMLSILIGENSIFLYFLNHKCFYLFLWHDNHHSIKSIPMLYILTMSYSIAKFGCLFLFFLF